MAAVVTPFPSGPHAPKKAAASALPTGREERYAAGKALRQRVAREQHGEWTPGRHRRDPVELVIESSQAAFRSSFPSATDA